MIRFATSSVTGEPRKTIRSLRRREKISNARSPRPVCSITIGIRFISAAALVPIKDSSRFALPQQCRKSPPDGPARAPSRGRAHVLRAGWRASSRAPTGPGTARELARRRRRHRAASLSTCSSTIVSSTSKFSWLAIAARISSAFTCSTARGMRSVANWRSMSVSRLAARPPRTKAVEKLFGKSLCAPIQPSPAAPRLRVIGPTPPPRRCAPRDPNRAPLPLPDVVAPAREVAPTCRPRRDPWRTRHPRSERPSSTAIEPRRGRTPACQRDPCYCARRDSRSRTRSSNRPRPLRDACRTPRRPRRRTRVASRPGRRRGPSTRAS